MSQQVNLYQPIFRKEEKKFSTVAMLQAMGLVVVDHANHGALTLGEGARGVFKKERVVTLRKDRPKKSVDVRRQLARTVDIP